MDKGSEVIKIVEWNLKGQGACFIFRTAERTFPTVVCTFRSGEYKQEALSLHIQDGFI